MRTGIVVRFERDPCFVLVDGWCLADEEVGKEAYSLGERCGLFVHCTLTLRNAGEFTPSRPRQFIFLNGKLGIEPRLPGFGDHELSVSAKAATSGRHGLSAFQTRLVPSMIAPVPSNEAGRLKALREYAVLDTPPEREYDAITALAAEICGAPVALITLIDESRQWFKSKQGLSYDQTPRAVAFCAHLLDETDFLEVHDACRDVRFADNPHVTGEPGIRFYAGAPLVTPGGETLGSLCVIDRVPRTLTELQRRALLVLSQQVMVQLQLRRQVIQHREVETSLRKTESEQRELAVQLEREKERLIEAQSVAKVGSWETDLTTMNVVWSDETHHIFETDPANFAPTHDKFLAFVHPAERAGVEQAFDQSTGDKDVHTLEHRVVVGAGRIKWVEERWRMFRPADGRPLRATGTCRDITAAYLARVELERSHRALQMVNQSSAAMIRATSEPELLRSICEIATEVGGYRMAWVGYALDDEEKSIQPQFSSGDYDDYIAQLRLSWSEDQPGGQSPSGRAVRSGEPRVLLDLAQDSEFGPWRDHALSRGFRGLVSLPLVGSERTLGVMVLYLPEVRSMPADELGLLQALASDLTFGILTLRAREEKRRTREAILAMARALSEFSGAHFFERLAQSIIDVLGANAAIVARLTGPERTTAKTLAAIAAGQTLENFDYALAGTPCEHLACADVWIVPRDADKLYEQIPPLPRGAFEAHAGTFLLGTDGKPIGLLFVQFARAIEQPEFVGSTLKIFATRAAGELERQDVDARTREQASMLDRARDAILVRDLDHKITFWNQGAERLYGWSATEVLGSSVRTLLYGDPAIFDAAMVDVLTHGEWLGELDQLKKDGRPIVVEARWTLVRDDHGEAKGILAINTDITERKKLEQQFLRAQRIESIGTLAGGIAHDLNNLLAPITMGVDLLKRLEPAPRSQRIIDTMERSARRGADLVKQVLSFSRGVEGVRVPLDVRHVIREVDSIVGSTFPKNITFEVSIPRELWLVTADPTQINQILLNLCVNARDAMPTGGVLGVEAVNLEIDSQYAVMNGNITPGRYVRIRVSDTGCGIPKEIVDRIFEPFFTTKEIGKGTGLGLSTVMGIVRSHGGFVNVYSEPGKGSTFKVYLPATRSDAVAAGGSAQGERSPAKGNGELILVVDDEASILTIVAQTLEMAGYRVVTAVDGADAVAQYASRSTEIALVLTDMMMPIMDGPALVMALRRINPNVVIIAASGFVANGAVAQATGTGVRHFLAKPYSAEALLTMIRQILSGDASRSPFPSERA